MRKKAEKKLISLYNFEFVNCVLKDQSLEKKKTESTIAEEYLLNSILPANKSIANVVLTGYTLGANELFQRLVRTALFEEQMRWNEARPMVGNAILVYLFHYVSGLEDNQVNLDPTDIPSEDCIPVKIDYEQLRNLNDDLLTDIKKNGYEEIDEKGNIGVFLTAGNMFARETPSITTLCLFVSRYIEIWSDVHTPWPDLMTLAGAIEIKDTPHTRTEVLELCHRISEIKQT